MTHYFLGTRFSVNTLTIHCFDTLDEAGKENQPFSLKEASECAALMKAAAPGSKVLPQQSPPVEHPVFPPQRCTGHASQSELLNQSIKFYFYYTILENPLIPLSSNTEGKNNL